MKNAPKNWKLKTSKYLVDNPWIKVRRDDVQISGKVIDYYFIELKDDVIVAGRNDKNEFLFVKQYRPASEITTIELPAGYIDTHESPKHAAKNELLEETGYEPQKLTYIGKLHRAPTRIKQEQKVFLAEDLVWKGQNLEKDEEHLEVITMTLSDAVDMIKEEKITDMATVSTIFIVKQFLKDK